MFFFDICYAIFLLFSGFLVIVSALVGGMITLQTFDTTPIFSVIMFVGMIGIITIGILMISGAFRKSKEIINRNTKEEE